MTMTPEQTAIQTAIVQERLLAMLREKRHSIDLAQWKPEELLELRDRAYDARCSDLVAMADNEIVNRMRQPQGGRKG